MNFNFINSMDGWTSPEKAKALYELAKKIKPKIAVEIGTFGGRSIIPIALAMKEIGFGKAIGIDPYDAEESAKGQTEPTSEKWWRDLDHEKVYQNCLWHIKKQGLENFVEIIKAKSRDVESPNEICFLSIDGNHGEDALLDAKKFAPNVKLGGYCLLDDLDWTGGYVRQAEEFIKSIGFSFVKLFDGQTGLYQRVEIVDPNKVSDSLVEERKIIEEKPRLTIAFVTARQQPCFEWFFDSLANQLDGDKPNIIIVDFLADKRNKEAYDTHGLNVKWVEPMPTIWQGKHKVTKADWWAMSNARNTAFCLCETEWIAFLDDRCVLLPSWLEAVKRAMRENYILVGSYEKRSNMAVEGGFIKGFDKLIGKDPRLAQSPSLKKNAPHSWFFGCTFSMPLEVALKVNGFETGCDSLSMEDSIFGLNLRNAGYEIVFDPNMRMIEDRTDGEISSGHGIDNVMKRSDFGKSPNDKSHAALTRFGSRKVTEFTSDLRGIREQVLKGMPFAPPVKIKTDWYDGGKIPDKFDELTNP